MTTITRVILKWRTRRALVALKAIDVFIRREEWPNWKRKQFWRDFTKNPVLRDTIYLRMENHDKAQ